MPLQRGFWPTKFRSGRLLSRWHGLHYNPNIQTLKQIQDPAEVGILLVASERLVETVPAHPGNLSELFDVLRLHDGLNRIQNAAEVTFLDRLSQIRTNSRRILPIVL